MNCKRFLKHGIGAGDPGVEPVREDSLETPELLDSIHVSEGPMWEERGVCSTLLVSFMSLSNNDQSFKH